MLNHHKGLHSLISLILIIYFHIFLLIIYENITNEIFYTLLGALDFQLVLEQGLYILDINNPRVKDPCLVHQILTMNSPCLELHLMLHNSLMVEIMHIGKLEWNGTLQ